MFPKARDRAKSGHGKVPVADASRSMSASRVTAAATAIMDHIRMRSVQPPNLAAGRGTWSARRRPSQPIIRICRRSCCDRFATACEGMEPVYRSFITLF